MNPIHFGYFATPLGVVLLAATETGLCALKFCARPGDPERLAELQKDYPHAALAESPAAVQPYADQLLAYLERAASRFAPPLDILTGTPFQRTVWAELQKTEPGETLSYSELAGRINRPDAIRAVASACARNRIAIAIPCHRVVRRDGSLAGYRWGLHRKQWLLELEAGIRQLTIALNGQ